MRSAISIGWLEGIVGPLSGRDLLEGANNSAPLVGLGTGAVYVGLLLLFELNGRMHVRGARACDGIEGGRTVSVSSFPHSL